MEVYHLWNNDDKKLLSLEVRLRKTYIQVRIHNQTRIIQNLLKLPLLRVGHHKLSSNPKLGLFSTIFEKLKELFT